MVKSVIRKGRGGELLSPSQAAYLTINCFTNLRKKLFVISVRPHGIPAIALPPSGDGYALRLRRGRDRRGRRFRRSA